MNKPLKWTLLSLALFAAPSNVGAGTLIVDGRSSAPQTILVIPVVGGYNYMSMLQYRSRIHLQ